MAGIVEQFGLVTEEIKNYIKTENTPTGILSDVQEVIYSNNTEGSIDEPCIWIVEHPTIESEKHKGKGSLSHITYLQTSFEFVCVEYDPDLEQSDIKAKNLASRVGSCIIKNFNKGNNGHIFSNFKFETLYPAGEVAVAGKSEKVPVTSIVFTFYYKIDWWKCLKQQ